MRDSPSALLLSVSLYLTLSLSSAMQTKLEPLKSNKIKRRSPFRATESNVSDLTPLIYDYLLNLLDVYSTQCKRKTYYVYKERAERAIEREVGSGLASCLAVVRQRAFLMWWALQNEDSHCCHFDWDVYILKEINEITKENT